jgi:hypothetical protein
MRNLLPRLFTAFSLLVVALSAPAAAQQAGSCAKRVIGLWQVTVKATGQTYPATYLPNGTVHVVCPLCNPTATWTCSGNTTVVQASGHPTVVSTLSPDGRTSDSSCCTAVRIGGLSDVPSPAQHGASPDTSGRSSGRSQANCSDITGLGGGPAPSNCGASGRTRSARTPIAHQGRSPAGSDATTYGQRGQGGTIGGGSFRSLGQQPSERAQSWREKCEGLERRGQTAATSCWGGLAGSVEAAHVPGLADYARQRASELGRSGPTGDRAQQEMPIAPGCNADYPIRRTGNACNGPGVGWSLPGFGSSKPVCCTKNMKQQLMNAR